MTKKFLPSTDKKIYSVGELKEAGLSYYKINQLADDGILIKLNKKYYENTNYTGEESDFLYVSAYAPKGVICLMSAAAYYNLTTYRTAVVDVAIQRKSKISTVPNWPRFDIFYFPNDRFETGVSIISDGKNEFRIYDMEKTVVDIVFYRERVGIEETKEILVNYLNKEDRNLNQLIRYAKLLKCSNIMKTYLEVLL